MTTLQVLPPYPHGSTYPLYQCFPNGVQFREVQIGFLKGIILLQNDN